MSTILVLPDCQVRVGDDLSYLHAIGNYIIKKQPDHIINLGDFGDLSSLSSYDVGKRSHEGRRYALDVKVVREAMAVLMEPLFSYNDKARKNGKKQYKPTLTFLYGNHEQRIERAIENDAKLEGAISIDDLGYEEFGWTTKGFLETFILEGVAFSHYFVTGVAGRAASSAAAQFRKTSMSCVAGHQQGLQIHTGNRADGALLTSVICGSCYQHDESYLGPQGNKHWRGLLMLYGAENGQFDLHPVPLHYIVGRYGD